MKKHDLAQRIKELELEIQNLKSNGTATNTSTKPEEAVKEIGDYKERFRNLFNNAPLGYQSLDINGNFIDVNQQWLDNLGYSREEVIGKWFGDFLSPEYQDGFRKRFPVFKSKGEIHSEFEVVHKNGNKIFVAFEGKIGYDSNGDFKQTHCILQDITGKKKADAELIKAKERAEKSEERFRMVSESVGELIWEVDTNGLLTYVSSLSESQFGYKPMEIIGKKHFYDFFAPERKEAFKKVASGIFARKEPFRKFESPNIHRAGHAIMLETNGFPILDDNGNLVGYRGTNTDITEHKKIEEEKDRFIKLVEASPASITIHDLNGKFLYANESTLKLHGYTREEFMALSLHELDVPESAELIEERMDEIMIRGEVSFEVTHYHKNGSIIPFQMNVKMTEWGNEKVFQSIGTDITESKQKEKELIKAKEKAEESEIKFKAAFYTSPDSISIHTIDGRYIEINQGFKRSTGYTEQDIIGKLPLEINLWSILEDREKLTADLEKNGIIENFETVFRKKDGTLIPALVSAQIFYIKEKPHIYTVTKVIVERKRIEQDLIAAKEEAENANRLKTEFLHNMSHEIRTPLNGIMGFSEILNNPSISEEKRNNYTKIIRNSGKQLLRIIDDILEISTLETKQTKLDKNEFCLNQLLMEQYAVFSLKSEENDVPIYLDKPLHDKDANIISDKTKLNKILSNLIENAIKFTAKGSIEIGYTIENELLKLYVRDTGIGISADYQQKIFERFSQEHEDIAATYGGLGLGLSICKENAELLGGDITLESEKDSGSTFIVAIPYKPAGNAAPDIMPPSSSKATENKTKTILVAEDEEMNYLYIEALFEDEFELDCRLIHAKNGKEALDICVENHIDLVLMDIKMPVMNGNEATQKIKEKCPDLPVIAQTAYSTESQKAEAMKHGYDDFMSKPLDKDRLFEAINKFVGVK